MNLKFENGESCEFDVHDGMTRDEVMEELCDVVENITTYTDGNVINRINLLEDFSTEVAEIEFGGETRSIRFVYYIDSCESGYFDGDDFSLEVEVIPSVYYTVDGADVYTSDEMQETIYDCLIEMGLEINEDEEE